MIARTVYGFLLLSITPPALAAAQPAPVRGVNFGTVTIAGLLDTPGPTWLTGTSRHFVLHLERTERRTSVPALLDSLESAWDRALRLLGSPSVDGIQANVFVTASRTRFFPLVKPEARGLTTRPPKAGEIVILVRNDSVRAYVQHEVMHVASYGAWGLPRSGAWLAEGLATFADGRCQGSTIRAVGRDLLAARRDITAQLILTQFVDVWGKERAASYVLAGTLVDYLWASRGREGVRRIWQGRDTVVDVGQLPGVGGPLTTAWQQYVARVGGTAPGISLASLATAGCG